MSERSPPRARMLGLGSIIIIMSAAPMIHVDTVIVALQAAIMIVTVMIIDVDVKLVIVQVRSAPTNKTIPDLCTRQDRAASR